MGIKIKICGIKNIDEVKIMNSYLPDFIGFIFASSKRRISFDEAKILIRNLDKRIKTCGVFVNEDLERVVKSVKYLGLEVVQLHGSEDQNYIRRLKDNVETDVWKAGNVSDDSIFQMHGIADKIILDSNNPGSGSTFDWDKLAGYEAIKGSIVIAGGLDHSNVSLIFKKFRPYCIDVSSGVEINGSKSKLLVKKLIEMVRGEQ